MRIVYVLFTVVVMVTADEHENVDIDRLLSDPNNFRNFANCFLDTAPCDDIGASFKKDLPDVIESSCENCTPEQKHIVKAFIDVFNQAPKAFEAFRDKYDPERKYLANLEAAVTPL